MTDDLTLPIRRFRFHGLRKLNWVERPWDSDYQKHMTDAGLDGWIEPGPIMVVVGPNAGGKTTVIDLFRGLANPSVWPSLPRENYSGDDFAGFEVDGRDFRLLSRFSRYTPEADQIYDWSTISLIAERNRTTRREQVLAQKYGEPGDWADRIQSVLDQHVSIPIRYHSAGGAPPGHALDDDELASLLNELSQHFPSVYHNPQVPAFKLFRGDRGSGRIGVLFRDEPSQHAFVHRSILPLGWMQIVSVLAFMRSCPSGALILLDEPDCHLHPSLQRVMLEIVARERERLNAQVIIATHSPVLSNPYLTEAYRAKVVVAARGRFEELPDSRRVLDDLGVTSSDLVQANGLVWVEGPSDRIYIKHWIELLARAQKRPVPIERVHYAFVSYGGSLLKYLTLSDARDNKVDLRAINRNFFVAIDRDLPENADIEIGAEKCRLREEALALGRADEIWVTQHYTIESYLPQAWEKTTSHVRVMPTGRTKVVGVEKVELAAQFTRQFSEWHDSFRADSDLPARIAGLLEKIDEWQTPQEIISLAYIPPFMLSELDNE